MSALLHTHGSRGSAYRGKGGSAYRGIYLQGAVDLPTVRGRGSAYRGVGGLPMGRVCLQEEGSLPTGERVYLQGGWAEPPRTKKADSTHPTGMLSCY